MLNELKLLATEINHIDLSEVSLEAGFFGPTLPSATRYITEQEFEQALNAARNIASQYNLNVGNAVDFWTEASLFSDAGIPAIVFGPGYITQAHTADEWVELSQLERVEDHYLHILQNN